MKKVKKLEENHVKFFSFFGVLCIMIVVNIEVMSVAVNGGYKGRFRDRLRLIVVNRYKKIKGIKDGEQEEVKNVDKDENEKFVRERVSYIKERLSEDRKMGQESDRVIVRGRGISNGDGLNKGDKSSYKVSGQNGIDNDKNDVVVENYKESDVERWKDGSSKIGEDLSDIRDYNEIKDKIRNVGNHRIKKGFKKKYVGIGNFQKSSILVSDEDDKEKLKEELACKILKKIRNKLDDNINEIEVLESELYFLNQDNERELELEKIIEIKKRLDEFLKKIEEMEKQYEIFRNNYYLEDIIDLDDKLLVDDIIAFKDLHQNEEESRQFVLDYKLLDEYRDLYDKLEEITNIRVKLVEENENKITEYMERDKKYDLICEDVIKLDDIQENVDGEIKRQNEYLDNLLSKVDKIDKNEFVRYHFRGLGELIGSSLRYVGLLMASPLAGFLPGIAVNTLVTRNMIRNIRRNMRIEEVREVSYVAEDYSSEIRRKLEDMDSIYYVIDDAIEEVSRLKNDFLVQYNSSLDGYKDTMDKICKMERKLVNNRKKVDIIKRKMIRSKKINEDKMIRVKKLNQDN